MKKNLLLYLFLLCLAACVEKTRPENKNTPEEKKVLFTYNGTAQKVFLAGNFNGWKVDHPAYSFTRSESGEWRLLLPVSLLIKGKNEYKYIADGEWITDSGCPHTENHGLAGKSCVLTLE